MKRITLQPAFVLHRRAYRETSVLLELFTLEHGRISVMASGVRKLKSTTQGLLQPFMSLLVTCSGNGELLRLTEVELNGPITKLSGECVYAGLYLNELLSYLLEKWDAHPSLFHAYAKTLSRLVSDGLNQKTLRLFEKVLLEEIGYGLLPKDKASLESNFHPEKYYRFIPEQGFFVCNEEVTVSGNVFPGKSLLAIAAEDLQEGVLQDAKRLMRLVLTPLLGSRSIHSRKLLI